MEIRQRDRALRILLTNDDGIHAPGLLALREELVRLGEVQVVAPAAEQSGVGLGITYLHPLTAKEELRGGGHWGWAVAGSPADCVKLGVLEFCGSRPDVVLSGINSGANTGINVLYSGTVAGAIEGAFFGITSIAVSLSLDTQPDYPRAARRAVALIEQLFERSPASGSLWNLNLPATRPGWPLGLKMTPLGLRRRIEKVEKRLDPRGKPYYWSGIDSMEDRQMEPGTDVRELAEGFATLTPLSFDLTHTSTLERLRSASWTIPPAE